jgi:hypothetical protein
LPFGLDFEFESLRIDFDRDSGFLKPFSFRFTLEVSSPCCCEGGGCVSRTGAFVTGRLFVSLRIHTLFPVAKSDIQRLGDGNGNGNGNGYGAMGSAPLDKFAKHDSSGTSCARKYE